MMPLGMGVGSPVQPMQGMVPGPPAPLAPLRSVLPMPQPATFMPPQYQSQAMQMAVPAVQVQPQMQTLLQPQLQLQMNQMAQVVQPVERHLVTTAVPQLQFEVSPMTQMASSVVQAPAQVLQLPSYTPGVVASPVPGSPRSASPLQRTVLAKPPGSPMEAYPGYAASPLPTLDLSSGPVAIVG